MLITELCYMVELDMALESTRVEIIVLKNKY